MGKKNDQNVDLDPVFDFKSFQAKDHSQPCDPEPASDCQVDENFDSLGFFKQIKSKASVNNVDKPAKRGRPKNVERCLSGT